MKKIVNYYRAIRLALSIAWVKQHFTIETGWVSHRMGWKTAWNVGKGIWLDEPESANPEPKPEI